MWVDTSVLRLSILLFSSDSHDAADRDTKLVQVPVRETATVGLHKGNFTQGRLKEERFTHGSQEASKGIPKHFTQNLQEHQHTLGGSFVSRTKIIGKLFVAKPNMVQRTAFSH